MHSRLLFSRLFVCLFICQDCWMMLLVLLCFVFVAGTVQITAILAQLFYFIFCFSSACKQCCKVEMIQSDNDWQISIYKSNINSIAGWMVLCCLFVSFLLPSLFCNGDFSRSLSLSLPPLLRLSFFSTWFALFVSRYWKILNGCRSTCFPSVLKNERTLFRF